MPYYANAGEAFWNGANAGANMASKWVSAFKYGDEYRSNKDFEEQARGALDTYSKGVEEAKAIQDVSQREARMQELLQARNDGINKAALNLGDRGGKVAAQYIGNLDAADQNVSNETLRRNQREIYADNPRKYTVPRMGFSSDTGMYGNNKAAAAGAGFGRQMVSAFMQNLKGGGDEDIAAAVMPFGMTNDQGALYFGNDPADMPATAGRAEQLLNFTGTAYGWQ